LTEVPASIAIIGGGATGVEFAYLFRAFGAAVTVVELLPRLVPGEHTEVSRELERSFGRQGIDVMTGARVSGVPQDAAGLTLNVETAHGPTSIQIEKVLSVAGVRGNVEGLGLEAAGVDTQGGFIQTDDMMRTNVPCVYAIGDVTGRMPLAHVASAQGVVAVEALAEKDPQPLDYALMPRAIYCEPQITSFGYTEEQAEALGYTVSVGRFPLRANGRALALGHPDGFVLLVTDKATGRMLGAHMVGAEVTELLPEVLVTAQLGGTGANLGATVHSHPTLSEAVKEAAMAATGRALHM
jgi:dihydrolipoamide dehydrogenase